MTTVLPLIAARPLGEPMAWCRGEPRSAGRFVAEAIALAERLPASGRPINLCQDRWHFALGLAAALLRGQTSLLPPNALPETLQQVPGSGAAPYLLVDDATGDDIPHSGRPHRASAWPVLRVQRSSVLAPAISVPTVASALPAVCLLTSGSTGAPQPHFKSFGSLVANIQAASERLASLLARPTLAGVTLVATVPAQHSYGLESSVLLALLGGAAFECGRPFYPADIAAALAAVPAPRALVTTPFHLKTLLLAELPLPPTELVLSATALLSPQLAARAEAAMGGQLIEIYGATECGQVASRRTTAGDVWKTLGELRIGAEAAAPGKVPRTCSVSGGHVQQATVLADQLELLDERHFRLLGRADDLIHVAGKRSSLAHLNYHLNRVEGVDDGAFWLPDDVTEGVVRPVALVVAPGLGATQIISALRLRLEPAFVPRRVVFVDALPRQATGKLTATDLRQFALLTLAAAGPQAAPASAIDPADGRFPGAIGAADGSFHIAADHPVFAGHFPGRPIVPGALLLSLVMVAVQAHPGLHAWLGAPPRIDNAKFLAAVTPGSDLRIELRTESGGVVFEIHAGSTLAARGRLLAPP